MPRFRARAGPLDDGRVDAPAFRIWPPVALGVPLAAGLVLQTGPFRVSRNPLYVGLIAGLIALDTGWALLADSVWVLVLVPVGVAALWWGAVRPEQRYLSGKFGAECDAYRARVRRWV